MSLQIRGIIAKGRVTSLTGTDFQLKISLPEDSSLTNNFVKKSENLKIRIEPGLPQALQVFPEEDVRIGSKQKEVSFVRGVYLFVTRSLIWVFFYNFARQNLFFNFHLKKALNPEDSFFPHSIQKTGRRWILRSVSWTCSAMLPRTFPAKKNSTWKWSFAGVKADFRCLIKRTSLN